MAKKQTTKATAPSSLDLTNGNRPPKALQEAMGRTMPLLTDEQCVEFAELLEEHGGWPFAQEKAQHEFRQRYEVLGDRWVKL